MNPSRNEHTIVVPCCVSGQGYWSGKQVQVVMNPAPAGAGLCFVRTDLPGSPRCAVATDFRHDAQLRTNLRRGDATFQMVEHILAALYALHIDNCVIEVDGEELPGLDGSCAAYVNALQKAGLLIQKKQRASLVIDRVIRVESDHRWIEASPPHDDELYFEYRLGFDTPCSIPNQTFGFDLSARGFIDQVASARTFVTELQANHLRSQGVAAHVTNQDLLVFGEHGPVENTLRFNDECARHKTLDMIGDLAVTGVDLIGRFVSHRGGHSLNGRLSAQLAELIRQKRSASSGMQGATTKSFEFQNRRLGRAV